MSSTSHLRSPGEAPPSALPSDNDVLVRVEGVSKIFCRDFKKSLKYGLLDSARDLFSSGNRSKGGGETGFRDLRDREFYAVKDASFELRRGECLGLIGHNGAGKTTLLKMLNGLIKPDSGRIEMRGRVGALIALGAGFNPILSGRENIYINGSILGLPREEIDQKIDDIIDFSGVRKFIDSPVQTYSSGMKVRLGFAVATAMEPDVLILDEILAVGDAAFRNKCYTRISEIRKNAAVVFVSHNMDQIGRICNNGMLMDSSEIILFGPTIDAIDAYERINSEGPENDKKFVQCNPPVTAFDVHEIVLSEEARRSLIFKISVHSISKIETFNLRVVFYDSAGQRIATADAMAAEHEVKIVEGENEWQVGFEKLPFKNGYYKIAFVIDGENMEPLVWSYKEHEIEVLHAPSRSDCNIVLELDCWEKCLTKGI